jgi:hypothetical protein
MVFARARFVFIHGRSLARTSRVLVPIRKAAQLLSSCPRLDANYVQAKRDKPERPARTNRRHKARPTRPCDAITQGTGGTGPDLFKVSAFRFRGANVGALCADLIIPDLLGTAKKRTSNI